MRVRFVSREVRVSGHTHNHQYKPSGVVDQLRKSALSTEQSKGH
ncbi:hypothetical protein HanRHA438_Chr14g0634501 [Helianthus annuus]|nr:hypothetical protein HanIR_Chr14g0676091 [Helianthus annuus]KAJ0852114.1 hypothetical protein HanRHA438_Chr14g0634501 [Helianthus annuus]